MDGQHEGTSSGASQHRVRISSDSSSSFLPNQQQFQMNQLDAETDADVFNLIEDPLPASPVAAITTDEPSPSKTLEKPYEGMVFDNLEAAGEYYAEYGRQQGFSTRIRTSYKTKPRSDEVTGRVYVCVRQGKHQSTVSEETPSSEQQEVNTKRKRLRSTLKSGCPAYLRIIRDRYSLKWTVSGFSDDHNHKSVTPCKRMKMKSNKHMPQVVKDLTEAFHREHLQVSKLPSIFGGAEIGFDRRDCWNHLRDVRHRELETGDAQFVLNYFRKQQAACPQFYYSMQCDASSRATNFFWVDARSRMSYQYFGDVISFDTTYRTNKYDMPFAPFTGVNHHFQTIQFGCALLQDETEESFMWLFETWLEAMGGKPPISIITDQDPAMKAAIAKIFPGSRHRLCLWHIKKKFLEKLSHVYYSKSSFKKAMKACLHHTYTEDQFEEQWQSMMTSYNLNDNEWLRHLYEIRASWVPVYNRSTFYAGMNTTGRSEGVNAFFDDFVTRTTNLKEFVLSYEKALKRLVERESDEDFESEHKSRQVRHGEFLLRHAAEIYTRAIFKKIKEEWDAVLMLKVVELDHNDDPRSFKVLRRDPGDHHQFLVKLHMETFVGTCECQFFEFSGLICRHILKVLVRQDAETIPDHFILARWRKEANKFRGMYSEPLRDCDGEHADALRLNHMCQESAKLACFAASSKPRYLVFMESLNECFKKMACIEDPVEIHSSVLGEDSRESEDINPTRLSQLMILDPNISQTKGRRKEVKGASSSRMKSGLEVNLGKNKRQCKSCKKFVRHDSRNCPQNPNRKKNIIDEVEEEDIPNEDDDS